MKGIVKWFCPDKGYGFISADSGEDLYFHAANVKDPVEPGKGDVVTFSTRPGKKGKGNAAVGVMVLEKGPTILDAPLAAERRSDKRIECPGCGKRIVPRMIVYNGEPRKSVCPFCAATVRDFSKCFVATAVYEDPFCYQVCALRQYRDTVLNRKCIGRAFILVYYRISPGIAKWLESQPWASRITRTVLDLVVKYISRKKKAGC